MNISGRTIVTIIITCRGTRTTIINLLIKMWGIVELLLFAVLMFGASTFVGLLPLMIQM